MHTVVFGAGAVGGYFGGKLANAGFPVTFLVREKRYEQLKNRSLRVSSYHGDFKLSPNLARSSKEIHNPQLVILALKNYHLENAMSELDRLVQQGAKVLPLLNGVEHIERLAERYGKDAILGGSCYIESTLNENGDIIQTSSLHDIVFGPLDDQHSEEALNQIKDMFLQAKVNVVLSGQIVSEMWNKFMMLATVSGITAATRQPIGIARNDEFTKELLFDFVRELHAIAISKSIALPEDAIDRVLQKIGALHPMMTSSMHRDLEKGLPLEVDSLQGYALRLAKDHGISAPVIRSIYSLLHPYRDGSPQVREG